MLWQEKASWADAEKYFDCAFALENPSAKAGPGPFIKEAETRREAKSNDSNWN